MRVMVRIQIRGGTPGCLLRAPERVPELPRCVGLLLKLLMSGNVAELPRGLLLLLPPQGVPTTATERNP